MLFEKQQYQQDCVENIIRVLARANFKNADFSALGDSLWELAQQNNMYGQHILPEKKCLDVLMETGTGKTFTYLQTIFELNKQYQVTKFIIVLPRVSIKQGVLQNIKLTDEYFFNLYQRHINYIDYPKDGIGKIQNNFINSNDLSVLITTNAAFNSEKNNINKKQEALFEYGSTWRGIAAQKPVVIIDEPHLLKGDQTAKGLGKLKNSLFIRFGATFPKEEEYKLSNVVYMLDSISAFNQYLVKRIGVSTVYSGKQASGVAVTNIRANEKRFDLCFSRDGQPQQVTLRKGDDVGVKSGISDYAGVTVTRVSSQKISLSNRREIAAKINYTLSTDEIRLMLRQAIRQHFEKERALFVKEIKALTLIFIPNVGDFRGENPRIKTIFEEEYKALRNDFYDRTTDASYRAYLDRDYNETGQLLVHEGYFSGDKGNSNEKEKVGVDIILNDKEKLLSLQTPLRFVFSVWALQEGWDNPNIFTICKLAASSQDTSRRQQVGRGLRLAVNQQGKRLTESYMQNDEAAFYTVNTLDMIVSGQEQTFIHQIQSEINDVSYAYVGEDMTLDVLKDKGLNDKEAALVFAILCSNGILSDAGKIKAPVVDFLRQNRALFYLIDEARFEEICAIFATSHRPIVRDNNRKRTMICINPEKWKEFKELWETINRKAKIVYKGIKEDKLIDDISAEFNKQVIDPLTPHVKRQKLNTQIDQIETTSEEQQEYQDMQPFEVEKFALGLAKDEQYPVSFVCNLFSKLQTQWFINDVTKARKNLLDFIKEKIHASILHCIQYEFVETSIYPNSLQDERGDSVGELSSGDLGVMLLDQSPPRNFLYDKGVFDSDIERASITEDALSINRCAIKVFAKLPKLNIPTPYKTYNPDFAYLIEKPNRKTLFLVVETKGYDQESDIPPDERQKISYGRKFFEQLKQHLPDIEIVYKTRINKQKLFHLLDGVINGG